MKILYAAANREGSLLQLFRFLLAIKDKLHTIKVAAYKKSTPNVPIDWNLDALQNIFEPDHISFNNDNLRLYLSQVEYFNPDLIISDLEPFTSYVALLLNKKLWHVSPSLLYYATPHAEKIQLSIYKSYGYLFNKNIKMQQQIKNHIFNADKNFIYSHLGDTNLIPNIPTNFEWIRPFYTTGKDSKACQHNLVAGVIKNDKSTINFIKHYEDAVIFTPFLDETYRDVVLKDVYNLTEFGCNIKNCNLFVSVGHADFLADAYYNRKYVFILPNFKEPECIINALYAERFNLGKILYNRKALDFQPPKQTVNLNPNIKSLLEKIEEI